MDVVNHWGGTSDITVVGLGNSTLDDVRARPPPSRAATLSPDPEPEKGFYYRSDHFEFAKKGVPALNAKGGITTSASPRATGSRSATSTPRNDYHKVSDEVKPDWDLAGSGRRHPAPLPGRLPGRAGDTCPSGNPAPSSRHRDAMLR